MLKEMLVNTLQLAFDSQGNPAISYYDATNEDLKYAHWNGTSWDIETVDDEGKVGYPTSLAFHSSGNPSIAYYDYTNESLNYAYWNGSAWNIQEVDDVGSTYNDFLSYNISLVLDPAGNPAIAYNDADPSTLKYACFNGTNWDIETVCSVPGAGWGKTATMDISPSSNQAIAFRGLQYAYWNGSSWDIETVDSGYGTGAHASLKFNSIGDPVIAYYYWAGYGTVSELRYAEFNGTSWDIEILDSVGLYPSLAFDPLGSPSITYYMGPSLRYAYWNGISWDIEVVDDQGNVGEYNSLAFDPQGNPAISYYDATNGFLKLAVRGSMPLTVEIDIKPGSYPNSINLGSKGVVPVAILSSDEFGATTVDPETVLLAGAGVAIRGKGSKLLAHQEDVNSDSLVDLVVQVETENLNPDAFQDGYAILTGETYSGQLIEGSDEITIIPPSSEAAPAKLTEFALHQNFCNPLNPDTWIPYQLAEDVNVIIRIYAVSKKE